MRMSDYNLRFSPYRKINLKLNFLMGPRGAGLRLTAKLEKRYCKEERESIVFDSYTSQLNYRRSTMDRDQYVRRQNNRPTEEYVDWVSAHNAPSSESVCSLWD